jgi:ribonuclease HII
MLSPTYELDILNSGEFKYVIGIVEVGRGPWAGPLMIAAYVFSLHPEPVVMPGVRDSKKLTIKQRQHLAREINKDKSRIFKASVPAKYISEMGLAASVGYCLNILVKNFDLEQSYFLLDGALKIPDAKAKSEVIIKGDDSIYSIAMASIYAKVYRDSYMNKIANDYPNYGFASNVGYGTLQHRDALEKYGITTEHRTNFKPVARLINSINPYSNHQFAV